MTTSPKIIIILQLFFSWDKTTVQNFKQIRVGDVGHSG